MTKILLVEDSKFFCAVVEKAIRAAIDVEVVTAASRAEAEAVIDEIGDDLFLALLDLDLPDASGNEIIEVTRSREIPTVVFTGTYNELERDQFDDKHVLDYVLKDSAENLKYLLSIVRRLYHNRGVKVIVADDSRTAMKLISGLLKDYNFDVLCAENGEVALELIKAHPETRLLITDYHMPKMDGFQLIKAVRSFRDRDQLAIIGVSSAGSAPLSAKFIKFGANDFIIKPFLREEFFCRVTQNMDLLDHIKALSKAANTDPLTGLNNRRYFFEVGAKILAAAARGKARPVVAMMDIDHFKAVNDTYGHDAGDEVLKKVAEIINTHTPRRDDLAARIGGEEFAFLLQDIAATDIPGFFNGVREDIERAEVEVVDGKKIGVTVSIGVCCGSELSLDAMLSDSDTKLYEAKGGGRNRVVGGE